MILDTNVLLAATDEGRAEHGEALAMLDHWPGEGATLYASGQILREYLAVATRPADHNGLGLSRSDAVTNVRAIRERTRLLAENAKVSDRLLELVKETACGGKQIHDANVVATMLVHGVDAIVTMNVDDFARFDQHVTVINLSS
ncbi:MAG: type II toxin-antitoxin system VapC family toxin [Streptosporangiaceae bacterium]